MSIRQTIKKNALGSLKHHWGRAIGILLFLVSINALFLLLEQFFCYLLSLNVIEEPALVVGGGSSHYLLYKDNIMKLI